MKMNIKIISILSLLAAAACSSSSSLSSEEARSLALQIVPGTLESIEATVDGALPVWAARVRVPNGALLQVELDRDYGSLFLVEDEAGPFTYELAPAVAGQLSFGEAKTKALAAKDGAIVAWNLKLKSPAYRHEFYVRDSAQQLWEIKLASTTGEIQSVEAKAAID